MARKAAGAVCCLRAPSRGFVRFLARKEAARSPLAQRLIAPGRNPRPVGVWLIASALMVLSMVVIGGYTRLSGSGLSMTRWRPVGYRYPTSRAEWDREFALYRQYPEFESRPDTTLDQFKTIFNVEYFHRLTGNLLGLVFGLPMLFFWSRGYFTGAMKARSGALLLMGGAQGLLGWWMVKSGLDPKPAYQTKPRVSTYRLVLHNSMAVALYSVLLFTGLGLVKRRAVGEAGPNRKVFRAAVLLAHLVAANLVSGAMTAGLGAGQVFNTWPLMNGRLLPAGYWDPRLGWRNLFENMACVQFNHRVLAYLTYAVTALTFLRLRRLSLPLASRLGVYGLFLAVNLQLALGIYMILTSVGVHSGVLHQANGKLVLTFVIFLLAMSRP